MDQKELLSALYEACEYNDSASVDTLAKACSSDIDAPAYDGSTAFSVACNGAFNIHVLHSLLKNGANVNQIFKNGHGQRWTALHSACFNGNADIFLLLLSFGADINISVRLRNDPDEDFPSRLASPLHLALRYNNTAFLDFVLRHSAASASADVLGSVLHEAVHFESEVDVEALLRHGAKVDWTDSKGRTAVMRACGFAACTSPKVAMVLVRAGAKIDPQHEGRMMYVALTEKEDCFELVKLLLERGVSPNAGWQGRVPIVMAATLKQFRLVHLLLSHGARVDAMDGDTSALHEAAWADRVDIATLLLDSGAPVDAKCARGVTPLFAACRMGHVGVIELLLQRGANVNEDCTPSRLTALTAAIMGGSEAVVQRLLGLGVDVNWKDAQSWTPLHYLAHEARHKPNCFRLLLLLGADANARDDLGCTPLHILCNSRYLGQDPEATAEAAEAAAEAAQLLIDHGAVVEPVDRDGFVAFPDAMDIGNDEVADVLFAHKMPFLPEY